MGLEKLTISVENEGATLVFGNSFVALFNPDKLVFSKTANWRKQNAKQRDCPELQFSNAEPRTLHLELLFDTYDPDDPALKDQDVRTKYTDKIFHLTTVEKHGELHRPPVCRLSWGSAGCIFQGVLQQLEQQFILFAENGTPVRAKLSCTFMEWSNNDLNKQNPESSDIAKMHELKRGETLSSIAAKNYLDPRLWRAIAIENAIDDPLDLKTGSQLLLPPLPIRRS
ncbi:MAG: LysM peptidoglycan-binding domain-containing protein [Methylococcaceae bacterium]|nr:LysM peptidoglycan-binding domain-containing protein [Methylococcaceae bacterium]